MSGKKEIQKNYYHHSGYPGGLKTQNASQVRAKRPESIIRHAVVGMLPRNKIGKAMVKKLYVYAQSEHPFGNKIKQ
ncbi:uL13 family ribosomal protein [Candidatus Curtissbacteria bacterium]|nr:uL13 family ribosomal protein [Candidatus Curtissbacteria bacterium]